MLATNRGNLQPLRISLGTNCEITFQLRRCYELERAYPFDWWITPICSVARILYDGFALELTPNNLCRVGDGASILNKKYGILHHHDFTRDEQERVVDNWIDEIPRISQKYQYLTKRFFNDIRTSYACSFYLNRQGHHAYLDKSLYDLCHRQDHVANIYQALKYLFPQQDIMLAAYNMNYQPPPYLYENYSKIWFGYTQDYHDYYDNNPEHFAGSLSGWHKALAQEPTARL
jgi:Putative papain-like cysteine peptidase (DUF1796)